VRKSSEFLADRQRNFLRAIGNGLGHVAPLNFLVLIAPWQSERTRGNPGNNIKGLSSPKRFVERRMGILPIATG
jgi:hypothetical protein